MDNDKRPDAATRAGERCEAQCGGWESWTGEKQRCRRRAGHDGQHCGCQNKHDGNFDPPAVTPLKPTPSGENQWVGQLLHLADVVPGHLTADERANLRAAAAEIESLVRWNHEVCAANATLRRQLAEREAERDEAKGEAANLYLRLNNLIECDVRMLKADLESAQRDLTEAERLRDVWQRQANGAGMEVNEARTTIAGLKAALEGSLEAWLPLDKALTEYFEAYGGEHEDPDCPQDDTCRCPLVVALGEACKRMKNTMGDIAYQQRQAAKVGSGA